ncbi:MAG: hypothetical protein R6V27_11350 [Balneolaceae bacterium]
MIQRILIFFLFVLVWGQSKESAFSQTTIGARAIGAGQTSVAVAENQWALFSNPGLIPTKQKHISFYGFRYTGITEITDFATQASLPVGNGGAAVGFHRYGFDLFSETHLRAGYKHRVDRFHAGVALNFSHIQQGGDYGSASAVGIHAGFAVRVIDQLWLGTRALNLNQPAYNGSDELLPEELAIGLSFLPANGIMISADAVKDVRFPLSLRTGAEAELMNGFVARTGFTTHPKTYSGGFGYNSERWQLNVAVQQHIPLGLSPALDLGIRF